MTQRGGYFVTDRYINSDNFLINKSILMYDMYYRRENQIMVGKARKYPWSTVLSLGAHVYLLVPDKKIASQFIDKK